MEKLDLSVAEQDKIKSSNDGKEFRAHVLL